MEENNGNVVVLCGNVQSIKNHAPYVLFHAEEKKSINKDHDKRKGLEKKIEK